jgi:outer membrane protein OmpA-like peptidoglycan-associated protein
MIRKTVSLTAILWLATAFAAAAQPVDNGMEVRVNPVGGAGNVLLYPGGEYMRVVPALLQPGQSNAPVHLHMPTRRAARVPAPVSDTVAQAAPRPARRARATATASAAAPEPPRDTSGYVSNITGNVPQGAAGLYQYTTPPAPAPKPRTQVAGAEPAPSQTQSQTGELGLTKQSMILFAHDAADPAESALSNIKLLAGQLVGAMTGPNSRVQIQAYGGAKGDKGSDARRLSLKRALAIRQVLIDDGVPSERIDVRAMGGVDDSGPTDRVDVYVKA